MADENKDADDPEDDVKDIEDRQKDYTNIKKVQEQLDDLYEAVVAGFEDKQEQASDIDEYWDIYNCQLNENQSYFGNSAVYVSQTTDAIDALTTRDNNTLFPINGRYASAVGPNGTVPFEVIALLDYYVRITGMRQNTVPCLLRTGRVTGHFLLGISWKEQNLYVTRKMKTALVESELGTPVDGEEEVDDVEEEEINCDRPDLQVYDPRDVAILPASVETIEDADIVAVRLYLSKGRVKDMISEGVFDKEAGETLLENFAATPDPQKQVDTVKKANENAGIRTNSKGNKTAVVYMVWSKLKLKGKEKRRCVSYFGGAQLYLGCKRNPFWNDRVPILGQPARKMPGTVWGKSPVDRVKGMQYALNDAVNMGLDSAQYSLCPITVSDPENNPQSGSMVLNMGALWQVKPESVKFMEFPQLWEGALKLAGATGDRIMQSMGINPALLPHGNAGKKPTQAQVAQEQQVAQESTTDAVSILEEGIFGPLLEWFFDLDYQYRKKDITVKQFGQMGLQAKMLEVPPFETYTAYAMRWYGTEGTKAVQQVQQQIAAMNVLRGIPPQQLNGRKVDIGPIIEQIAEVAFGPRIAPNVLIDQRHQLSINPAEENLMMQGGFPVHVQPMDNDVEHLKVHMQSMQQAGDPQGLYQLHILAHMQQLSAKSAQAAGPQQGGQPGSPGGAGPGNPGNPGTPRIGAQAGPPKPMQAPAGAIHQDAMNDPNRMPR